MILPPTHFELVCDFHKRSGIDIPKTPQLDIFYTNPKLIKDSLRIIASECEEFIEATESNNNIEKLDATVDISYVVLRMTALIGSNMDELKYSKFEWCSVYSDIMGKKDTDEIKIKLQDIEKNIEEKDYNKLIHSLYNLNTISEIIGRSLLKNYVLKMQLTNPNYTSYQAWDEAFIYVHENNMTKFCKTEEEAIKTVKEKYFNDKIYTSVTYKKSIHNDEDWIVYDKDQDKILKSIEWKEVKLDKFFE